MRQCGALAVTTSTDITRQCTQQDPEYTQLYVRKVRLGQLSAPRSSYRRVRQSVGQSVNKLTSTSQNPVSYLALSDSPSIRFWSHNSCQIYPLLHELKPVTQQITRLILCFIIVMTLIRNTFIYSLLLLSLKGFHFHFLNSLPNISSRLPSIHTGLHSIISSTSECLPP